MKLIGLIMIVGAALLAQSMCVYAGGLRMGESSSMNMLASNECACQANMPGAQIVSGSDGDGASDLVAAPTCVATPGVAAETRCTGTASGASAAATGKTDPAASAVTRKLRGGVHWQSLLPGVMK